MKLNFGKIDLEKHRIILPSGTILYRRVEAGIGPLSPIGRGMRFVTEPPDFDPEKYAPGIVTMGTGALCLSDTLEVSRLERKGNALDEWEIKLVSDIEAHDLDSVCKEQGISKPYMTYLDADDFTELYGLRIQCLRCESKESPKEHNVVVYYDYFPDFEDYISKRKLN